MCETAVEAKGHKGTGTTNGDDCLKVYTNAIKEAGSAKEELSFHHPFDAVILDYKMPGKDGKEVAKEIIKLNPQQRIIFASAYVKETLMDSVRELNQVTELIQKPFEPDVLVDVVEDTATISRLGELNHLVKQITSEYGNSPDGSQIEILMQ